MKPGATAFTVIPFGPNSRAQGLGHPDQAGLRGGIVGLPEISREPHDRRSVDDFSSAALDHVRSHCPGAVKHASKVYGDHLVPLLRSHLQQGSVAGDSSVVNQDVDHAKSLKYRSNHSFHLEQLRHIRGHIENVPALRLHRGHEFPALRRQVANRHPRSFACEEERGFSSKPVEAASDDCYFLLQPHRLQKLYSSANRIMRGIVIAHPIESESGLYRLPEV